MTKNCRKSFDSGKANRELNPLHAGRYKLEEAFGTWRRRYDALNEIGHPLLALQNATTRQLKELVLLDTWLLRY